MASVASGTKFPTFQQGKDFFSDGIGAAPEFKLTSASAPGVGGESAPGLDTPSTGVEVSSDPSSLPATLQDPTPGVGNPYQLGYQQTGALDDRLFNPVTEGAATGGEDLQNFASMFLTDAGPERTYEGIGAEAQLSGAVEGRTSTDVGKALVGAQYEGPAGLDPEGSAYLNDLARQLQDRQTMLERGGGLTEAIQQSTPGLTPGESRFQAQSMFGEGWRDRVPQETAGVQEFMTGIGTETQSALDYAAGRTSQEQAIAQQSQDYLTGRSDVISGDLTQAVTDAKAREAETLGLWDQIQGGGGTADIAGYLKQLQDKGAIEFAGTGGAGVGPEGQPLGAPDVGNILSDIYQGGVQADLTEAEIMAKYPDLAGSPQLIRDLSGSGRGTTAYYTEDDEGALTDLRATEPDAAIRTQLYGRQRELEKAFDPLEAAAGRGAEGSTYNPLYFGEGFEGPDVTDYLGFKPGISPARENLSSEDQRSQFNNIMEMLGKLDRISEAKNPFHAAMIYAEIDNYLADEESAFEEKKGELSKTALEWRSMVHRARRHARKVARHKPWKDIQSVLGGSEVRRANRAKEQERKERPTLTGLP